MSKEKTEKVEKKEEKPEKSQKKGTSKSGEPLPVLMELFFTFSKVLLVGTAVAVGVISFFSGASLLHIVLRVGATILCLGFILWFTTYIISNGSVKAVIEMSEQAIKEQKLKQGVEAEARKNETTMEFEA